MTVAFSGPARWIEVKDKKNRPLVAWRSPDSILADHLLLENSKFNSIVQILRNYTFCIEIPR